MSCYKGTLLLQLYFNLCILLFSGTTEEKSTSKKDKRWNEKAKRKKGTWWKRKGKGIYLLLRWE